MSKAKTSKQTVGLAVKKVSFIIVILKGGGKKITNECILTIK